MPKMVINKIEALLKPSTWYMKRRLTKLFRKVLKSKHTNSYEFAIVCVKREPYVMMTINNINSLHYINPNHKFTVYCDNMCHNLLVKEWPQLDYPENVYLNCRFVDKAQPWQYSKVDTLVEAARNGKILIDADGFWHNDPIINKEKITFQVSENTIREKPEESLIVKNIFKSSTWLDYRYYTSAFVYIPKNFLTQEIVDKIYEYLDILFHNKYEFLSSQEKRDAQKRQSEQFAINLALLTHYPKDVFAVLKQSDGTKDKNIIQPLYYGCANEILE